MSRIMNRFKTFWCAVLLSGVTIFGLDLFAGFLCKRSLPFV